MGQLDTPQQLFTHKLGAALTMENTVLQMLGELEQNAQQEKLKEQFRHHADETRQQISNLEQAFSALGESPQQKPCPAIDGLQKEGKETIQQAGESVVDAVILAGAAETEHHEIAVYEGLITHAGSMGHDDIVALLEENLEQEKHTLVEVDKATQELAQNLATQTA